MTLYRYRCELHEPNLVIRPMMRPADVTGRPLPELVMGGAPVSSHPPLITANSPAKLSINYVMPELKIMVLNLLIPRTREHYSVNLQNTAYYQAQRHLSYK